MISIVSYLRKRFRPGSAVLPVAVCRQFYVIPVFFIAYTASAQSIPIQIVSDPSHQKETVTAGGAPFTTFFYPDTLEKPVLYPIYAPDGQLVTRGFPLAPRAGEPVDHPHHLGLWFDYENVNGLDFWNNSYAIAAAKKSRYGWIRTDSILQARKSTL